MAALAALKDVIAKKRSAVDSAPQEAKKKKFMTKAEKAALAKGLTTETKPTELPTEVSTVVSPVKVPAESPRNAERRESMGSQPEADADDGVLDIEKPEVFRRLRLRRQPITLFGETDRQRIKRLLAIEIAAHHANEEGLDDGQRNFDIEQKKAGKAEDEEAKAKKVVKIWNEREATNKEDRVLFWLKRLIQEWSMEILPMEAELRSTAFGRQQLMTFKQSKEYIKPLLGQLKRREIPTDMLARLVDCVTFCNMRMYNKALDAYILIAIGNAPWPMGVTQVGIHERASREKIHTSSTAHILNDETTRKYIQTVKRIMTFCQRKYPPDDVCFAVL